MVSVITIERGEVGGLGGGGGVGNTPSLRICVIQKLGLFKYMDQLELASMVVFTKFPSRLPMLTTTVPDTDDRHKIEDLEKYE